MIGRNGRFSSSGNEFFNALSLRYVQAYRLPQRTTNLIDFMPIGQVTVQRQQIITPTMGQNIIPIGPVPTGRMPRFPSNQPISMQQPKRMVQSDRDEINVRDRVRNEMPNENRERSATPQCDQMSNFSSYHRSNATFDIPSVSSERIRNIHIDRASIDANCHSNERDRMSTTTNSNFSRRQMIELARAEEERILQERRDSEYLGRKYSILLDENESINESRYTDRSRFTENWVNTGMQSMHPVRAAESVRHYDSSGRQQSEFQKKLDKIQFDTTSPMKPNQFADNRGTNKENCKPSLTSEVPIESKVNQNQSFREPSNLLSNLNEPVGSNAVGVESADQCTLTKAQIASRHVVSKELPPFNGNPAEWPMFISRFNNSTKMCGFSNQENLDRLQKCLKGKAYEAVRSRLLTEESVPEVIKTLKMLYGRPELVINSLLENIRQEQPLKSDHLSNFVDFAMKVCNLTAVMVQSGLQSHLSNPTALKELVDKLPPNFKVDWARHRMQLVDVNLATFGKWLHQMAEVISSVTEPTVTKPTAKKVENSANQPKKESTDTDIHRGSQIFVHGEKRGSDEKNSRCPICKKKCDKLENCSAFLSYDVDRRWKELKENKLCRKCLGRHGNLCRTDKKCGINGCIYKHHSLLHDSKKHSDQVESLQNADSSNPSCGIHGTFLKRILLRIVPVWIHSGNRSISPFAYLDDGSDLTIVNRGVVDRLQIRGTTEPLCLLWTGDVHREETNSQRVTFCISGVDQTKKYVLKDLRTVEELKLRRQTLIMSELTSRFEYLKDVPMADYRGALPEILIGCDNVSLIAQHEIVEGGFNQPIASRTRLGWSIYGDLWNRSYPPTEEAHVNPHNSMCPYNAVNYDDIHRQVKDFFTLENFGVRTFTMQSKDDERALALLKKYTRRIGNRFETALLWRHDKIHLPSSYDMALKRLKCLEKHKPAMIQSINATIVDYISKDYVTKLTDEMAKIESPVWYLPIFAVCNAKKPDKIRTVFDAAATVQGVSLNSMLLRGPDQLASLVDILRRFREKRYAIAGDIKEMFHQIKIREEDKQAQRFLWRNGNQSKDPDQYVMNVMTFGATCSPSAAQFVKNLNASEHQERYPRAVDAIVKNHYVDDWLDGADDEIKLSNLVNEVIEIHSRGGFEMRNFLSNSINIKKRFGEQPNEGKNLNLEVNHGTERVLGMWWDTETDNLTFSLKFFNIDTEIVNHRRMPTKREVLKILMSVFDPLGFLSHYLIQLKILLQEVWRGQLDWDERLNTEAMEVAWKNWLVLLPKVEEIQIPRLISTKLSPNRAKSTEMHVFVDASEQAFTAVAFLRVEDNEGVDCRLIGSKARVAPLKHLSIPRMELQAGVLGTRLITSICSGQTFKIDKRQIWTDSSTLLSWIRSDHRKYHQFVANRIGEILDSTDISEWRWIPSHENVADDATKWKKPPSFSQSNRWFSGPSFLKLSPDQWPQQDFQIGPDTTEEMRMVMAHSHMVIPVFVDVDRFSRWQKMHRSMAFVVRYVRNLRAKIHRQPLQAGPLTKAELLASEKIIVRQAQFEAFSEEFVTLKRNKELQLPSERELAIKKSSKIYKCSPYVDVDDLIRIRGRIDSALRASSDTKRPIILPRHHKITRLLVDDYHRTYHHRNDRTVHNQICQKFFIASVRVVIRSVRNECQRCKIRGAKPIPPEMADLPAARLAIGLRAFSYIGIDYFGPIFVALGRSSVKRWGMLITCLTVRAINIEIVYSANTESCVMGLRNHINEFGPPQEIYSDFGSNFRGTNNMNVELQQFVAAIDIGKMATEFTTICTQWHFNPPVSPHMGGTWERMVRSVKTCLYDILPARNPTDDALRNLVLEAVNVVNSRPLTYVPLDHEGDEILTPNHFIKGSSNGVKPMIELEASGPILRSKWKENQRLMDLFWQKFIDEFLPELTRKTKWFEPVAPLKVDDIVLIIDKTNKRNVYPKARIIDAIMDSRGQVRRVRVQRADGSALWRSAHGLAKLDVHRVVLNAPSEGFKTKGSVTNVGYGQGKVVPE